MPTPRWLLAALGIVLAVAGSAWGYTLVMSGRVTKCETLVEVQGDDISDIVEEQRAMRKDFNDEQRDTRKVITDMWKDLKGN